MDSDLQELKSYIKQSVAKRRWLQLANTGVGSFERYEQLLDFWDRHFKNSTGEYFPGFQNKRIRSLVFTLYSHADEEQSWKILKVSHFEYKDGEWICAKPLSRGKSLIVMCQRKMLEDTDVAIRANVLYTRQRGNRQEHVPVDLRWMPVRCVFFYSSLPRYGGLRSLALATKDLMQAHRSEHIYGAFGFRPESQYDSFAVQHLEDVIKDA